MRFRILILLIFPCVLFGQSPERFSFQAVVYDNENKVVSNKNVRVRISILTGSINGAIEYQEVHSVLTNNNGLFSLEIGNGTPSQGTFGDIQWGSAPHFLKREIDPTGGTNYLISGISQLLSVPYSIHSNTANKLNINPGLPGQILTVDENGIPKWTGDAYPSVTTVSTSSITATSAIISVNITSSGGQNITSRGVVYASSDNPTLANSSKLSGSGTGSFTLTITDLSPNTTYFVRGFATNSVGTGYGTSLSFNTTAPTIPILSTNSITSITQTSAISGGVISSNGGSDITARGVVWSTSSNPTISNSKTTDGAGTGNFSSSLSGLSDNTTYYVRAYATNGVGTAYGNEISFTTSALTIPILTTTDIVNVTNVSASSGGTISSDGGSSISAKGVVWSTSSNPTISDNKTIDGTGTESFNSILTGLSANTTYYVRAYATNSSGTGYGNQRNFTTLTSSNILPTLNTNDATDITSNSAKLNGELISQGGSSVTSMGFVWNTSGNPTISDNIIYVTPTLGIFNSTLSSLLHNQTIFYKSFAVNNIGFSYGQEKMFTVPLGPPQVKINFLYQSNKGITIGSTNLDDGGNSIIEAGIVYGTNSNPTLLDNKIILTSSLNLEYDTLIENLFPGTKYFFRAFATNPNGTGFSAEREIIFENINSVIDIDGNIYNVVKIGDQYWIAENLKTTKFRDGSPITYVIDNQEWINFQNFGIPAHCVYGNDFSNLERFGIIYNRRVLDGNICPTGFHIPTASETTTFLNSLEAINDSDKRDKLVDKFHIGRGKNYYGFSARLGGYRNNNTGSFGFDYVEAVFLSFITLHYNLSPIRNPTESLKSGYIRCLKD